MQSPLGKYGQIVAAIVAIGVIGAYVAVIAFGAIGGTDTERPATALKDFALIALGAVFGSFAAVNGIKGPVDAAHRRLDRIEVATGTPTHGSYMPTSAGVVCPVCGLPLPAGEEHHHTAET